MAVRAWRFSCALCQKSVPTDRQRASHGQGGNRLGNRTLFSTPFVSRSGAEVKDWSERVVKWILKGGLGARLNSKRTYQHLYFNLVG